MVSTTVQALYDAIFEEGFREGALSGKYKWHGEGRLEEGIFMLLELLQKRFGEVSVSVKKKLYAKQDPIELISLAVQLLDCNTIEEFAELL
jgi:hypothetical protein